MKRIILDASGWRMPLDLYEALLPAIGAPSWHGTSVNALVDSMIYGGINAVAPPYVVVVRGTKSVPEDVRTQISVLKDALSTAAPPGSDANRNGVEVSLEMED